MFFWTELLFMGNWKHWFEGYITFFCMECKTGQSTDLQDFSHYSIPLATWDLGVILTTLLKYPRYFITITPQYETQNDPSQHHIHRWRQRHQQQPPQQCLIEAEAKESFNSVVVKCFNVQHNNNFLPQKMQKKKIWNRFHEKGNRVKEACMKKGTDSKWKGNKFQIQSK